MHQIKQKMFYPELMAEIATLDPKEWAEEYIKNIGETVKEYRQKNNWSAQQLSDETAKLGYKIPRSTIANLELNNKKTISSYELEILAKAFGVPSSLLVRNVFQPTKLFRAYPNAEPTPNYLDMSALARAHLNFFTAKTEVVKRWEEVAMHQNYRQSIVGELFLARVALPKIASEILRLNKESLIPKVRKLAVQHERNWHRSELGAQNYKSIWDLESQYFHQPPATLEIYSLLETSGLLKELIPSSIPQSILDSKTTSNIYRFSDIPSKPAFGITQEEIEAPESKLIWGNDA